MSDSSQGPGWWQASDGKWYSPESASGAAPVQYAAPAATPGYGYAPARKTNGLAIASLVCSLVSCGVGSIAAVILGHMAKKQIRETGDEGDGLATAGLVIGYIGLVAAVIFFVIWIVLLATADNLNNDFNNDFNNEFGMARSILGV